MDELGKILGNILSSMPSGNENAQDRGHKSAPSPDPPPRSTQESFAPIPETGGADFSGLLNSFSSASPPSSQRRALLTALKPYLRPARRAKLERAQNLINAAGSVRAVLGTLSTLEGAHDV